jgi:hypothetical protein
MATPDEEPKCMCAGWAKEIASLDESERTPWKRQFAAAMNRALERMRDEGLTDDPERFNRYLMQEVEKTSE